MTMHQNFTVAEPVRSGCSPAEPSGDVVNGMSVDIEDWFQVGAFEKTISRDDWSMLERRVENNTLKVLDLYAEAGVRATFFTLGWIAERHPQLMRKIVDAGHEVASHGYDHRRVFTLNPKSFAADLDTTRKILEDTSGVRVVGYRAPSFSIDRRTPWAHEVLADNGYHYSSSVAPVAHDHYGWRQSPRFAWKPVAGSDLLELPVTTAEWAGRRIAAGGGGFFRLFPYAVTRSAVRQVNNLHRPAIFYFHPWEIDPGQPRQSDAPLKSRLRHYSRLSSMAGKLGRICREFKWDRIDAILPNERARTS